MSGQLVEQWPIKTIGEFCKTTSGSTPSKSNKDYHTDGTIPWLLSGEVNKREITESKNFITELALENTSVKLFPPNTVLVAMYGATAGQVGILRFSSTTNQAICGILPNDKIIPEYLYYALENANSELVAKASGSAQPNLSQQKIKAMSIPVPSLEEQQRIVSILDNALNKVENAKAQAQMNLQGAYDIFTSFLDTIITDTNNDWKDTVLGEEYDVRDGTHDSPKYHEEGHYLLTSKNLKRDGLTYAKAKFISPTDYQQINKRSKVDKGDVLFAMIGTIGNPVVIEEEPDFAIKNVALFKVGKKNGRFLKYLLQSKSNMEKMLRDASGTTQRFVSLRYLRGFPIRLPSDEDQHLIVNKLDELFDNTEQLAKKYTAESENLDELKQSILQEAFNGTL